MDVSTRTQKILAGAVLAVIVGILVVGAVQSNRTEAPANAEESQQQDKDKDQDTKSEEEKPDGQSTGQYAYTAATGDSYTGMARQAVKRYAADNKISLSPAQAVAAETEITAQAGSPALEVDQQVTVSPEVVKTAVEKAANMTADEQAAWQPYADLVAW